MIEDIHANFFDKTPDIEVEAKAETDLADTEIETEPYKAGSPISAADIMNTDFEPLKWIVEGILPEGLSLIAGPSKLGKSWLCFDLAIAVATGGEIFGKYKVEQGDVLMLALEDGPRRIKSRLKLLAPNLDCVRRHIKRHRFRPGPRETLLTLLVDIRRWLCGIASAGVR